jgi:predicted transglutaminase-like cysteine proteinase
MRFATLRPSRRLGVVAAALAMVLPTAPTQAAGPAFSRVSEQRLDALWRLPQWQKIVQQLPQQELQVRACLSGAICADPGARRLAVTVAQNLGRSPLYQIERVNSAMNRIPYREDREQFGREDYWESPLTFARSGGDCEDYAIAKYFVLKLLGFTDVDLRVVVLTRTDGAEVHALLLVRAGQTWLVLDNRNDSPGQVADLGNWIPQYAVNESGGFRYLSGAAKPLQAPAQR